MSFLYDDPQLIKQLLKQGQAAPDSYALIRSLIDSLQQQMPRYTDPSAPPVVSHEENATGKAPQLTSINLESLGALIDFLATNKITVDGQRVAYHLNEDPQNDAYQLYQLEPNAGLLEVQDRTKVEKGFFVNKDLLNKYIQSLQAQLQKNPNPVFEVQLRKIIQFANNQLEAGISEKYKEPEKVLPDDTVLDYLPEILNSDPRYAIVPGNIPLTFGDIKDPTALNAWLSNHRIGLKVGDRSLGFNHPDFDHCAILRVLHARAQFGAARATSQVNRNSALAYGKQIEKLAPSINGPDGKACSLAVAPTTPAPSTQKTDTTSGVARVSPQVIAQVVSTLPFAVRDINLDRIEAFFTAVEPIMRTNGQAMQNISNVRRLIDDLNARYIRNRIIPLGMNLRQFANMLTDQKEPGKQVFPAIALLNQILDGTRSVVEAFYYAYGDQIRQANPSYLAYILGQIGRNPDDTSIYSRNSDDLENLRTSGKVT